MHCNLLFLLLYFLGQCAILNPQCVVNKLHTSLLYMYRCSIFSQKLNLVSSTYLIPKYKLSINKTNRKSISYMINGYFLRSLNVCC